jgi:hypothetical protein
VVDTEEGPIQASHKFWITVETFDPYHIVIDTEEVV